MDTTVRDATPRTAEPVYLRDVWRRAERADLVRTVPLTLLAAVVAGSIWFFDLSHWPPRLDQPVAGHIPGALGLTAVFLVLFAGITFYQKHTAPQRYVSPLLGLDSERRRAAKQALNSGAPSSDGSLREVETARAEQLVRTAPATIGSAMMVPAMYLVVMIMMFVSGSTALGVLWILVTTWTAVTTLRNVRAGQLARAYLERVRSTAVRD